MTYAEAVLEMSKEFYGLYPDAVRFLNNMEMDYGNGKFLMFHLDAMGLYGMDILKVFTDYANRDRARFSRLIFDRSPNVYEVLS